MLHIPFKGATQQIQDLIGGSTMLDFQSSLVVALPQIKAGKVKPIAVLTAQRAPQLPDVPTAAESGYPGVVVAPWFGMGGPAGMPPDVIKRIHEAMVKGMQGRRCWIASPRLARPCIPVRHRKSSSSTSKPSTPSGAR